MLTNDYELVVSEGKKHFFENVLTAIFFSAFFFTILRTLYSIFVDRSLETFTINFYEFLGTGIIALSLGLRFGTTKTVLIDTGKDKLISRYEIGPFSYDAVSAVPELQYLAVFKNSKEVFEVNLWYKGNRHYKMYNFEIKAHAFRFAELAAERLKIDLLDATEKGQSKWIEKTNS